MNDTERTWLTGLVGWLLWALLLALLTYGLLSPKVPGFGLAFIPPELRFFAAKTVHVVGYTLLSAMVAWIVVDTRLRLAAWLLLSIHAGLTEYLQTFVEGRTGSVRDVILDLVGVSLGLLLIRLFRPQRSAQPAVPASSSTAITTSPPPQQ